VEGGGWPWTVEGVEMLWQGFCGDAGGGVQAAGLAASGSGSPVFLIHADGLSGSGGGKACLPRAFVEKRMLSQPMHERRVTDATGNREQGTV